MRRVVKTHRPFGQCIDILVHQRVVAIGFLFVRLTVPERVVAAAAALCLLGEFAFSDTVGFALTLLIVLWQWRRRARAVAA